MVTHDLIKKIKNGMYDETLKDIYVDEKKICLLYTSPSPRDAL